RWPRSRNSAARRSRGRAACRSCRARREGRSTRTQVAPDEDADAEDDEADDDVVETAKLVLQVLPVIAEDHPGPHEEHHPRHGADDREEEDRKSTRLNSSHVSI